MAARLVDLTEDDELVFEHALRLRDALQLLPMDIILAKVPGDTLTARARTIGVTREAYYRWLRGTRRPDAEKATRLSILTGVPASAITGVK